MYLPHAWLEVREAPTVLDGWAQKNVDRTHTKFTEAQIQFLRIMFDSQRDGGYKIKESGAHEKMKEPFSDTNSSSVYSKRLVLTAVQIKSWVSQKKLVVPQQANVSLPRLVEQQQSCWQTWIQGPRSQQMVSERRLKGGLKSSTRRCTALIRSNQGMEEGGDGVLSIYCQDYKDGD